MESLLVGVLVIALLIAVGMCVFAWRVLRRDHEGSHVRMTRLRAMEGEVPFAASTPVPAWPGRGTFVLVMLVCMGAGTVYGLYGASATFTTVSWPALSASAPASSPLELLSLTHRRDPDGDFIVTGRVQNPANGRTTPGVVAVVYLFGAEGEYFASGKAAIDIPRLAAGEQSPFMVRLPNSTNVSRYRLGFRMNNGDVFAHVDRRVVPLAGPTAAVLSPPAVP